jgi:hypothetical protein
MVPISSAKWKKNVTSEPSLFYSPFSFGRRVVWGRKNVLPFGSFLYLPFLLKALKGFIQTGHRK